MSPRAACRLETLGFEDVYVYEAGKQDWLAAGLPAEGTSAALPRAGDVARRDVPTCGLHESLGAVRQRVLAAGWDVCVVVGAGAGGVVLGLLRGRQLEMDLDDEPVERVMRPGPSTFRPNVDIREMAHYLTDHDLPSAPVTTSDGRLVGLLIREDAQRVAHHGGAEGAELEP